MAISSIYSVRNDTHSGQVASPLLRLLYDKVHINVNAVEICRYVVNCETLTRGPHFFSILLSTLMDDKTENTYILYIYTVCYTGIFCFIHHQQIVHFRPLVAQNKITFCLLIKCETYQIQILQVTLQSLSDLSHNVINVNACSIHINNANSNINVLLH